MVFVRWKYCRIAASLTIKAAKELAGLNSPASFLLVSSWGYYIGIFLSVFYMLPTLSPYTNYIGDSPVGKTTP